MTREEKYEQLQQVLEIQRGWEKEEIEILHSRTYGGFMIPKTICDVMGIECDKHGDHELFSKNRADPGLIAAYLQVKKDNPESVKHLAIGKIDMDEITSVWVDNYDGIESFEYRYSERADPLLEML